MEPQRPSNLQSDDVSKPLQVDIEIYIPFDNSITRPARQLESKSAAIDDIWSMLMKHLESQYVPGAQITVDEQLFPYRGRTRFTQYIPSKPAKYGIKIWWLCDANSNYPLKRIIYVRKPPGETRAVNQGERVVLKLVQKYTNSGRTVYADNFFSSYDLATTLMAKRLAFVGTMRKNKACIPKEMLDPCREEFSTTFGFHDGKICLCSYVPKKKIAVVLISTEHYSCAIDNSKPSKKPHQITICIKQGSTPWIKWCRVILASVALTDGHWPYSSICWTWRLWLHL